MEKNDRRIIAIALSIVGMFLMIVGALNGLNVVNTATNYLIHLSGWFIFLGGIILTLILTLKDYFLSLNART